MSNSSGPALRLAVLSIVTAGGLAACGGSSSGPSASSAASAVSSGASSVSSSVAPSTSESSSSTGSSSDAAAQVKQAFTTFFDGKTPTDQRVALLQNGQQFKSAVDQLSKSPIASTTSAQVSNVQVNGNTATVTYTVLVSGQPALTNQTGQAVLENGQWKVADSSFCALVGLQGSVPAQCANAASASASAS